MPYYYLEITKGAETGKRYALPDGVISIGRSSGNTAAFHPSEKSVSSHHAIIYKSPGRIMIQDLQSTNGTFVNEENVKEKDLIPGDIVGFGTMGPRAKLIESAEELSTGSPAPAATVEKKESTRSRTIEDDRPSLARREHVTGRLTAAEFGPELPPTERVPTASAVTMQIEQKLVEHRAGAADMHALLKNGRRVAKIIDRGNIGETQAGLIAGAYQASRKMKKKSYLILSAVIIVSLITIVYFAGRAWQYKQMVENGRALEKKIDMYDQLIAEAKADPGANRQRLAQLFDELDKAGAELASVHQNIRETDIQTFYGDTIEERISDILARFGETSYHVPSEMVDRVKFHVDVYSRQMPGMIGRYLKRRAIYYQMIQTVLADNNLPIELSYVAMLESGFNPKALSHAGARGMWQFMPATGRRYGLQVDDAVDERVMPEKATAAAAEYFKDLIGIFGGKSSLMLALAAYNAGEGRVQGALRKIEDPLRNRDFWYIYRMGYLAEETNEYIPRIFALLIISENPGDYGFGNVDTISGEPANLEAENDFVEFGLGADFE